MRSVVEEITTVRGDAGNGMTTLIETEQPPRRPSTIAWPTKAISLASFRRTDNGESPESLEQGQAEQGRQSKTSKFAMGKRTLQSLCGASEVSADQTLWKCLLAEFLGTAILVLIACGSCFNRGDSSGPDNVIRIAFGFGLTVASVAQAVGHISGGHLNPCVTAGMLVAGNISFVKGFFYVASQCIGAITGAAILQALTPAGFNLGITELGANITGTMGFFIEAAISFVLVMTVFGATDANRLDVLGSVPLAIGLSITVCHLFAVPLTGSSMNPARTFGPALILQDFRNHHIYWLGPLLGGVSAGLIYRYAFRAPKPSVDELERAARLCCLAKMSGKEPDGGVTSF